MFEIDAIDAIVAQAMDEIKYPATPAGLFDPIRYTLDSGGKRLRPQLVCASCAAVGGDPATAAPQAAAIEMFHNFTLLHDDVMDCADVRRGRPTVHVRWDNNTAILSGDTMLTMATELVSRCRLEILPDVLGLFNDTAIDIYRGQQYDMEFESRRRVSIDEYIEMIRLKTSVLLGCACSMGAIIGNADKATRDAFQGYGECMGLAFQLRDDWLDTYGNPAVFGKTIGGDIINEKKTWLLITALDESNGELDAILGEDLTAAEKVFGEAIGGDIVNEKKTWLLITALNESNGELDAILREDLTAAEKVRQVVRLYDRLGLRDRAADVALGYARRAITYLNRIDMPDAARRYFTDTAHKAATRDR